MAEADEVLDSVRGFVLDMDGTTYLGGCLLPGASELISFLRERDIPFLFLTNNSSRRGDQYADKLRTLGLDVDPDQVFTSGEATASYLRTRQPSARVYLVGTEALEEEFVNHGFRLTLESPEVAVLGFDTSVTYEKLWKLCDFVRAGIPYIATHPDLNCPVEGGYMPDIGAMISFVETSTGRRPDAIIGKPYSPIVEALSDRMALPVASLCMIGDRLYTDIALGAAGMMTVLVLTGEARRQDLADAPHSPDIVVKDLEELVHLMEKTRG